VRTATIGFFVGTGARFEPEDKAGLSHFLEHMVFKGTASYPTARQLSEAIEGVGGVLDASTAVESTVYWAKVAVEHFSLALRVLTEMLLCPAVPPAEVEKERRVIGEELHMLLDSPPDWAYELLGRILWPGHALGRDIAGTPESVGRIGREDLLAYREACYHAGTMVAVVAGAMPADEVTAALAAALAGVRPGASPTSAAVPADVEAPRVVLGRRDIEQANLCLALPALSYKHPDRYVLLLLDTILGAGMSSRLFQAVREERALAYSIYSSARQHADVGALTVYAGVAPERAAECLAAVWAELERLAEEEVGEQELRRAKEYNKGRILLRMEDTYGVASWFGAQELLLERIEEVDAVIARIEAVRPADVHRLARALVRRECIRLAAVGPFADEGPLREALGI
jgi:predicted Zn-dependent peptidase